MILDPCVQPNDCAITFGVVRGCSTPKNNAISFCFIPKIMLSSYAVTKNATLFLVPLLFLFRNAFSQLECERRPLESPNEIKQHCRVYLAESSIPNAGFGVFAGENIGADNLLSSPDVSIPVLQLNKNNGGDVSAKAPLLESHTWDKFSGGSQWEMKKGVRSHE